MQDEDKQQPKTPKHRRLIKSDTPGIYRRGSRWVAITYHGRRPPVKTYHRAKAEAKEEKARRDSGERPTSREAFDKYAERWIEEYRGRTAKGLAPSTRTDYAAMIRNYAIPFFGSRPLGDLGPLDVKLFIEHLAKTKPMKTQKGATKLSAATVRRVVCPLKAMLAEAYELELLRTNPANVRVYVPGERVRTPPKTISSEQIAAILSQLAERDRILFLFLARTGVRIGEALGGKWRDLEQTDEGPVFCIRRQQYRGQLREETKTDAGYRRVALMPGLMRELVRTRAGSEFPQDEDPMFPTLTGTHQDGHNVRRRLRPAAEAAGVPGVTPHVFRHSLATELRDKGYGADVIAKVLGHEDETFTRRTYIHTKPVPRFDDLDERDGTRRG